MLLDLNNVRAWYGQTQALHGVSLRVPAGSVTVLLGANGAGKTSVLRSVSGMIRCEGSIRLEGEEIGGRTVADIVRMGVAHVPEGRGTFMRLTVEENLRLGGLVRGPPQEAARARERIYTLMPRLAERRRQQAGTLSGGEQQMLAIARALTLAPRLMLLDEPSLGLAPMMVDEVFDMLLKVQRETGVGVLLVEQNAALALGIAADAYLIETGRVVRAGRAGELAADDGVRRAYLGY